MIQKSKRYETKEAAEYLSQRTGRDIPPGYVTALIREAVPFSTKQIGKYSIVGRFIQWMGDMIVQQHGYHSPLRPNFGEWLDQNHHRRPRLDEVAETTVANIRQKHGKQPKQSENAAIKNLLFKVEKLEKKVAGLENTHPTQYLSDGKTVGYIRQRITSMINRCATDNGYEFKELRGESYTRFFKMVGGPDEDYRTVNSPQGPSSVIEYIESKGYIYDYWEALPQILPEIERDWGNKNGNHAQQELNL